MLIWPGQGPVTIDCTLQIGVEMLDAPVLRQIYGAWKNEGCTVNPHLGPDTRLGRYGQGRTDADRDPAGARITGIEVDFP